MKRVMKKRKNTPLVGLEPTTFELEVQHASPLRHRGNRANYGVFNSWVD